MSETPSSSPAQDTFRSPKERRESHKRKRIRHRTALDRWLEVSLAAVVLGSVLAIGSIHIPTLLVLGFFATLLGALALHLHRDEQGWPLPLPALGIAFLTLYTVIQAIPLPASLLSSIAPHNDDVWVHALSALGQPAPSWRPISLDPGATWAEALKGFIYFAVAIASHVVTKRRGSPKLIVTIVFLSGLTVALLTLAHGLAGMTKVMGVYEPIHSFPRWAIGPLLNVNHLAGYLNLGAMCGLGVLLSGKSGIPRWAAGLGTAAIFGVSISAVSRGGVLLLPVGVVILILLLRSRPITLRKEGVSRRWLHILTLVTAAGGVGLAALGLTTRHWDELLSDDLSKLKILDWAKPLVKDHAVFGVGRGAFETVYPAYRPTPGHNLWTHPENLVMQWVAEWGLPVAVLGLGFFAWMIWSSGKVEKSAATVGAVVGIVILVVQNWVDFSLEVPGMAVAVVALMGGIGRGVGKRMGKGRGRGLLIVVGFALLGMVGYRSSPTALQDRLAFQRLAKAPMPKEKFDPLLKAAVLRHPAEPYLLLVGAQRAWQVRDDNPLPFLQRVFERSKTYGRAHLLLAEILFAKDAKLQALMELKYACRDEPGLATSAVALAIQHTLRQEELSRIVPPGPDGAAVLDTLGAWMHRRNRQVGESFDHQALALDPDRMGPRLRRASDIIEELSKKQEDEAAKTALGRKLEEHIRHIERVEPRLSHAARLRAQAFMAVGKAEKADQLLKVTCEHVPDRHACLQARVPILEALDRPEELDEVLEATAKAGCTSPQSCARAYQWLGAYEQRRKSLGKAANAFQKVTRHDPQNADGWIRWGDVSMALGMHAQAIRAYEQAARLRPKDEGVKKKLQAAQGKVLGDLLNR